MYRYTPLIVAGTGLLTIIAGVMINFTEARAEYDARLKCALDAIPSETHCVSPAPQTGNPLIGVGTLTMVAVGVHSLLR